MAKRNPERTRRTILEAAIEEFSRAGYGGARVDRIAAEAGANKRMIYHYFGSKEGLYQEVFITLYTEIREHEMAIELDVTTPMLALEELAGRTFDFFVHRPEFIRILNNENLQHASTAVTPDNRQNLTANLIDRIGHILEVGVKQGVFRPGIDPMQLYISIAALGYFYLSNAYTLGALFRRDLLEPQAIAVRRLHIQEAVRAIVAG